MNPHHLILLADPQLIDPHTYPGRPWPLSTLTIKHTDQYLRRSFHALDTILDPETIFFLGDLFDGGREWSTGSSESPEGRWHKYGDKYWMGEYDRFGKIYHSQWKRSSKTSTHSKRKLISSMPGNHDLGLGHGIQLPVRTRFETYFGLGNRVDSVGNHTFVSIDSVSLSAKLQFEGNHGVQPESALWEPTEEFLDNIQNLKHRVSSRNRHLQLGLPENVLQNATAVNLDELSPADQWTIPKDSMLPESPTIVLSHVPFWRDPDTPCGPLRERYPPALGKTYDPDAKDKDNAIAVAFGYQYQNVLAKELSSEILKVIGNVKHVFSGDDHDYCELIHKDLDPDQPSVPEITVKSTSYAMGVRKPGFLLVSLWNPLDGADPPKQTIQTHLCLLPDQLGILITYLQLILLTILVLAIHSFVFRRKNMSKEETLLPAPVTTPTYPRIPQDRDRTSHDSYSSSSANGKAGLAARSNAGRGQFLSSVDSPVFSTPPSTPGPSRGSFLSSAFNSNGERWKASSTSTRRSHVGLRYRSAVVDLCFSTLQVTGAALLWYWWLAWSV